MHSDPQRQRLDAWVRAAAPRAVAYATSLLRDRSRGEDVVQDCFCRLLQKADVYDLERDGTRLLFAAVSNACINENTRRRTLVSLNTGDDERDYDPPDIGTEEPVTFVIADELRQAIAEGLAKLTPMYRAALELRSLGHGKHEIAEMLGITPSHAGVLVHRARQQLAHRLAPLIGEEGS